MSASTTADPLHTTLSSATGLRDALLAIGEHLRERAYRFVAITPATHARVYGRHVGVAARDLRDVFGWNLPFSEDALPAALIARMRAADLLESQGTLVRSRVRCASVGTRLYLHGSFPTTTADAVFFGPDTYRFITALRRFVPPCEHLVDLCCGGGPGGLEVADRVRRPVVLADINPRALAFAAANAELAGVEVDLRQGDLMAGIDGIPEVIIANPPYLADPLARTYRDGGGDLGTGLSLRIVSEALRRLASGGRLILYTGVPVVGGLDLFAAQALPLARAAGAEIHYEELDPDVFGEELENPAYAEAERIAAVVLCLIMPDV